ncbi:MAG: indolepyruvate oxidoreductase subunit beta family protein [Immundisolibacter sp.]|uniref:indolepyruvate oxidoreductase subunit beta family protein n=1 Tax=Immundisolibacter sp. TaxID=1934948 RepID=UPI003EDF7344
MSRQDRATRILIGTVGGQGGGVLADWMVKGLINAGWQAQSIGLLGLSQRAGSVIYYVEARPQTQRAPILSAYAVPGDVDLLLSQEFLELGRLLQGGFAHPDCTIIANTYRYYGTLEKTPAEGGIYPSGVIRKAAETLSSDSYLFHAQEVVARAGLSLLSSNAVLLGAVVASKVFALAPEPFRTAIEEAEVGVGDNLKAFDLGYQMMREGTLPRALFKENEVLDWQQLADQRAQALPQRRRGEYRSLLDQGRSAVPPLARIFAEACYRLLDFQDAAYVRDYIVRVREIYAAEQAKNGSETYAITEAYGQHLANWMGYEDAQRVAQLKLRPERFAKMRDDHGVRGEDPFWVDDFLAPDPPQIYGMLPAPIGRWIRAQGRRWREDFDHISMPMRVRSNRPWGYFTLSLVSAMRHVRRRSLRHHEELLLLQRWRDAVLLWLGRSTALGQLAADAGRVVKGYGRVRDKALDDLWQFLDQGLPLLEQLAAAGGDVATVGDEALKVLASEAGKGSACLYLLRDRLAVALPTAGAAA